MPNLLIITHPEVVIDPDTPITEWGLSTTGRRRAASFAASEVMANVSHIWASSERKARDTGEILAAPLGLPLNIHPELGENDRSTTGFLPREKFEVAADAFFAQPDISFRGWETAIDAQKRILRAVLEITRAHGTGDLAIVTHGAVGTLLWCELSGNPIDRQYDQPSQGHYWQASLTTLRPFSTWLPMA